MIERMLAACLAAFAGAAAAQSAVQPATIDELEQAYQSAQSEILPELEAVPFDEATNAGIYQFKVGATVVVQPSSFLVFKASDGTLLNGDLPFAIGANEAQGLKEGKIPKDGYQFKACADATVFATPTHVCEQLMPASAATGIATGTPYRVVGISFDYAGSEDELVAKFESKWGKGWQNKIPVALAYNAGEKLAKPYVFAGVKYPNAAVVLLARTPDKGVQVKIVDLRVNQALIHATDRIDAIVKKAVKDRADQPF